MIQKNQTKDALNLIINLLLSFNFKELSINDELIKYSKVLRKISKTLYVINPLEIELRRALEKLEDISDYLPGDEKFIELLKIFKLQIRFSFRLKKRGIITDFTIGYILGRVQTIVENTIERYSGLYHDIMKETSRDCIGNKAIKIFCKGQLLKILIIKKQIKHSFYDFNDPKKRLELAFMNLKHISDQHNEGCPSNCKYQSQANEMEAKLFFLKEDFKEALNSQSKYQKKISTRAYIIKIVF